MPQVLEDNVKYFQFMGEDSMWQDPNGDVRKWQRDTGTAIWGDPDKQPSSFLKTLGYNVESVFTTNERAFAAEGCN